MRKYINLLAIIALYFLFPSLLFAQTRPAQRWVCLRAVHCWEKKPESAACIIKHGHRALLTAKEDAKPLSNKPTYIIECLATNKGQICTSGSKEIDELIYGKDNVMEASKEAEYKFEGLYASDGETLIRNPIRSKLNGEIDPVYWQSYTKQGLERKFFGLNLIDPNDLGNAAGQGAEQLATFNFEAQSNLKDCVSIAWDPYGRVFDSKSLEPVPEAMVELLVKRKDGFFSKLSPDEVIGGAIENPYFTKEDGLFNFVVPDGIYKLSVRRNGYSFPAKKTELNPNYLAIYSDIYPFETGSEIIQKGKIEHRDIPVDPVNNEGISYPLKLIEYFYYLDKQSNRLILEGHVSHPLTKILFYSIKPSSTQTFNRHRLIKSLQTDKYGRFKTEIDQSNFEPTEIYGDMVLEKFNFTQGSLPEKQSKSIWALLKNFFSLAKVQAVVQPATKSIRFNPILNRLDGYAYNSKGSLLPNAKAGVYLSYANKPYCETKTDNKGYYKLTSECLPDSPYEIRYSSALGTKETVSTSRFIAQNNRYLEEKFINLNNNKDQLSSLPSPTVINQRKISPTVKPTITSKDLKEFPVRAENKKMASDQQLSYQKKSSDNRLALLLFAGTLFVAGFILLIVGIYFFVKQRNTE